MAHTRTARNLLIGQVIVNTQNCKSRFCGNITLSPDAETKTAFRVHDQLMVDPIGMAEVIFWIRALFMNCSSASVRVT